MATGTNGIATESEAKSKLGYSGSVDTNKCCTKARAIAMGADSTKLSGYTDNQLVKYDDIQVALYHYVIGLILEIGKYDGVTGIIEIYNSSIGELLFDFSVDGEFNIESNELLLNPETEIYINFQYLTFSPSIVGGGIIYKNDINVGTFNVNDMGDMECQYITDQVKNITSIRFEVTH